jgi:hypothetical protein
MLSLFQKDSFLEEIDAMASVFSRLISLRSTLFCFDVPSVRLHSPRLARLIIHQKSLRPEI